MGWNLSAGQVLSHTTVFGFNFFLEFSETFNRNHMRNFLMLVVLIGVGHFGHTQNLPTISQLCPALDEIILSSALQFHRHKTDSIVEVPEKFTERAFHSTFCLPGFSQCWFTKDYGVASFKFVVLFHETTDMKAAQNFYKGIAQVIDECKPKTGIMASDGAMTKSLITKIWVPLNYDGKLRYPLSDLVIELNFSKLPTINLIKEIVDEYSVYLNVYVSGEWGGGIDDVIVTWV